ncbi:hypothetical protein [Bradyrhizobium iriomotense]|uniref:hypothetical protein n=1 Tax=Bradyrhizobium iriomotense TaxID=441950 RepID=UPI001B8A0108|nr:hypothetical protein [Bradyrhizobium iriomotense]MBR0786175.1 hypothetical protein [Bradyrhizobium iriomotense]
MITARRLAVVLLLLVLPVAYNVMADAITPACIPPRQAAPVPFEHVPSVLLRSLNDRLGKIAEPGTSFNATDVVWLESLPFRRINFFWTAGRRWVIATEHGGFVYNNPILVFDLGEDQRAATFIAEKIASPDTVCAAASDLIAAP